MMINARRSLTDSLAPPHNLLQLATLLLGQPPSPHRLRHLPNSLSIAITFAIEREAHTRHAHGRCPACHQTWRTFMDSALADEPPS